MADCAYCGNMILFGGPREGTFRFCNEKCKANGAVIVLASKVPEDVVWEDAVAMHQGACPLCSGEGPIDVHDSYRVWSALVFSQPSGTTMICCTPCANKKRIRDTLFSCALGWWAFPWGVLLTPLQILKNVWKMIRPLDATRPSEALLNRVRIDIAGYAMEEQSQLMPNERPADKNLSM